MKNLPDIQNSTEGFNKIPINKVGVRNIKIPIKLKQKYSDNPINTIATISSYCNLVEDLKGINMSRVGRSIFEILLETTQEEREFTNLNRFVYKLKEAHNTDNVYIKAKFDFIYKDKTPVTDIDSYEPSEVIFESILVDNELKNYMTVKSTELSLCPCSKEMSLLKNNINDKEKIEIQNLSLDLQDKIYQAGFGAHNQKSEIEIKIELKNSDKIFWIEDLLDIIKKSASAPTYSILKRPDEKWVTEVSYLGGYYDKNGDFIPVNNSGPKFVEDISRDAAKQLNELLNKTINDYIIIVNNQESIHSGDIVATAVLSYGKNLH